LPFNQNESALPFRILITPLDWGLGHATRCIPVIRYFMEQGCMVTIAASGATALLLKENFPGIPQLQLPGYGITYSRSGRSFAPKIIAQIPKILRAIRRERQWLREMQAVHRFDLVVSDNRYGLKIDGLPSVIMTHQLQIMTGFGPTADYLMRKMHYSLLEKFDACWVVDEPENSGLAGALSHPRKLPANPQYMGLLSQLVPDGKLPLQTGPLLVLLSGPEPMRGILENKILGQIRGLEDHRFHIVAGNPSGAVPAHLPSHVTYATHANARELATALATTPLVICRSGYSTLMDLAMLGKKALLIPTPGQSEQEYLARHLKAQGTAFSIRQAEMDLKKDIAEALNYKGFEMLAYSARHSLMQQVIDRALGQLQN